VHISTKRPLGELNSFIHGNLTQAPTHLERTITILGKRIKSETLILGTLATLATVGLIAGLGEINHENQGSS
jgi:hypothetical protein